MTTNSLLGYNGAHFTNILYFSLDERVDIWWDVSDNIFKWPLAIIYNTGNINESLK